jgi:hypothetical protein
MFDHPEFAKKIGLAEFKDTCIGDLGGVPLFKPSAKPTRRREAADFFRTHWLGLNREHVLNTARRARARPNGAAGVIVVAHGADRTEPILEALRQELINEIIVDEGAADYLTRELG